MARIASKLLRLQLLHRALQRYQYSSREELVQHINDELRIRQEKEISKESLQDDISDLREIGVDITYDKREKRYFTNSQAEWFNLEEIIDPLKILTSMGKDAGVPKYIFPEKYQTKGLQHISHIVLAIRKKLAISFEHHKYQDETWRERTLQPEALKEWRGRWYVLGLTPEGKHRVFGLDRIRYLRTERRPFSSKQSDLSYYTENFRHSYGIYASEDFPIEELILSFDREDGNYLSSRPLHSSQEIIEKTEQEVRIRLRVRITSDLKMELLSRANSIRIERPEWLRQEFLEIWSKALERNTQ